MKYFKNCVLVTCILCSFVLAGCGKNESESTDLKKKEEVITEKFDITSQEEKLLDLEKFSLEYVENTDAQPWFLWTGATSSENGYYFWGPEGDYGKLLTYFDAELEMAVPLCNKPECNHDNTDCNAYFNAYAVDSDCDFSRDFIQYYDGYVYIMGETSNGYLNLYRVAPDGSSYEEYMKLFKTENTPIEDNEGYTSYEMISYNACIHRGYVYYLIKNESNLKIRRMKLGGDTAEIIYEVSGIRPSLYRMEAYGDFVFFQTGNFVDESFTDIEGGIVAYNVETNEVSLVGKDIINTYIVVDKYIYYSTATGVGELSLSDGNRQMILEDINYSFTMSADEQYIYLWNEDKSCINVFNHQGKKINSVTNKDVCWCSFGDSKYFFTESEDEEEGQELIGILDVSTITEDEPRWIEVK